MWCGPQGLHICPSGTPGDWQAGGGGPAVEPPEKSGQPEGQRQQGGDPAWQALPGSTLRRRRARDPAYRHPAGKALPRLIQGQFLAQRIGLPQVFP